VSALVDTGAAISCCAESLIKKLHPHYNELLIPTAQQFKTANGKPLTPLGTTMLTFYIKNQPFSEKFFIFKELSHSLILGRNFLSSNAANIDFKNSKIALPQCLRIHAAEKVTLEPKTNYIITAKVTDRYQRTDLPTGLIGVITGSTMLPDLHITDTAVSVSNNNVPVMICNNSFEPKFITNGQHLGVFTPLLRENTESVNSITSATPGQSSSHNYDPFDLTNADCTPKQKEELLKLLQHHQKAFMDKDKNLGFCDIVQHKIIMRPDASYLDCQQFRYPPNVQEQLDKQIAYLLDQGVISKNKDVLFCSPLLAIKKHCKNSRKHQETAKDPEYRLVLDLRSLNANSIFHKYCMPNFANFIDVLATRKPKFFSSLDMANGFFQLALDEDSKKLTGFHWKGSTFNFNRTPQGMHGSPSSFAKALSIILDKYLNKSVLVYIDDVLIISDSFEQHLIDIDNVLSALHNANIRISQSKCKFAQKEITYLGHIISEQGISPSHDHVDAIKTFPQPTTKKQMKSFLGLVNYFGSFIPNKSKLVKPLQKLTLPKSEFKWDADCQKAFDNIKDLMSNKPFLHYPNYNDTFYVMTDASDYAISAVILNKDKDNRMLPISFTGRGLTSQEEKLCIFQKELLAIIHALEKFSHFLMDKKFTIYCDNHSLCTLLSNNRSEKRLSPKISRWILYIKSFEFDIFHIGTKDNVVADSLSRRFYPSPKFKDTHYPEYEKFPLCVNLDSFDSNATHNVEAETMDKNVSSLSCQESIPTTNYLNSTNACFNSTGTNGKVRQHNKMSSRTCHKDQQSHRNLAVNPRNTYVYGKTRQSQNVPATVRQHELKHVTQPVTEVLNVQTIKVKSHEPLINSANTDVSTESHNPTKLHTGRDNTITCVTEESQIELLRNINKIDQTTQPETNVEQVDSDRDAICQLTSIRPITVSHNPPHVRHLQSSLHNGKHSHDQSTLNAMTR